MTNPCPYTLLSPVTLYRYVRAHIVLQVVKAARTRLHVPHNSVCAYRVWCWSEDLPLSCSLKLVLLQCRPLQGSSPVGDGVPGYSSGEGRGGEERRGEERRGEERGGEERRGEERRGEERERREEEKVRKRDKGERKG